METTSTLEPLLENPSPAPTAGAAIRRRRRSIRLPKENAAGEIRYRQMSMRDLEERLQELEAQHDYIYKAYSRAVQVEIENRGEAYLLESIRDHRMINALIAALFDGSLAAFERETRVVLPLMRLLRQPRPLYVEGDPHFGQRTPLAEAPPHPCDYMVRVDRPANEPALVRGQLVGMAAGAEPADLVNQVVAVKHPTTGQLLLALAHPDRDLYTVTGEHLPGVGYGDIVGVSAWVGRRPRA